MPGAAGVNGPALRRSAPLLYSGGHAPDDDAEEPEADAGRRPRPAEGAFPALRPKDTS